MLDYAKKHFTQIYSCTQLNNELKSFLLIRTNENKTWIDHEELYVNGFWNNELVKSTKLKASLIIENIVGRETLQS